ncbi:MAG: hypothetical protein QOH66_2853, partial [Actinomycetota bacterium]|nr:hypothetical protein [Actinomycetota bacterium]
MGAGANMIRPPFSDTVAGRVTGHDGDSEFRMESLDGQVFSVKVSAATSAELLRNLDDPYFDASSQLPAMLEPGRFLFVHGMFYPEDDPSVCEAKRIIFVGRGAGDYVFERPKWWISQLGALARFYRRAQFGGAPVDFRRYRTILRLDGNKTDSHVQETDTISRLV